MSRSIVYCGVALAALAVSAPALAQEPPDHTKMSSAEVAKELANPNTALGFMAFPIDYISYTGDLPGAGSQDAVHVSFQPSLPYPLGGGVNLFVRPLIPQEHQLFSPSGLCKVQKVENCRFLVSET